MKELPGSVVDVARMPPRYPVLRDVKYWIRDELNAWTRHILNGQRNQIPEHAIFQLREVPAGKGRAPRITTYLERLKHPDAVLKYTRLERLYSESIELQTTEDIVNTTVELCEGLPLARTTHIYAAYTMELFSYLKKAHQSNQSMLRLISMVAKLEQYGPQHVGPRAFLRVACANCRAGHS